MNEPASDSTGRLLTPTQRRLAGFALGLFALLASGGLIVVTFIVLAKVVGFFSGVLWPLATAGILALMLQPAVALIEKRFELSRTVSVVVLYGVFILLVAGVLFAIIPTVVSQLLDFIAYLPTFWKSAVSYVHQNYPGWVDLIDRQMKNPTIKNIVDGVSSELQTLLGHTIPTLKSAGHGALSLFGFITNLAIIPIYLFFFLLSGRDPTTGLGHHLPFLSEKVREDVVFLVREFIGIVVSFFRGQLLIGLIMGILLGLGFSVIGLKSGLFLGLTLGILNIVPYLGTMIGLGIALPLAFFQAGGGLSLVGLVLLVFILVQNIEGWYLTPKIMGDRTGLHPVTIIVAIFFWGTALDGILGMILAIPLTAFVVTAWRLAKRKYLTPLV